MPGVRIISVNSVFFSNKYQAANFADSCSPVDSKAATQTFAWLESTLSRAAQNREKVWLMFHIPPGIDGYATMMSIARSPKAAERSRPVQRAIVPMWKPYWTGLFDHLVAEPSNTITAMFAGHDHTDDFRVIHGTARQRAIRPDRSARLAHLRPESRLSRGHLPSRWSTGRPKHLLSDQPPGCAERRSRRLDPRSTALSKSGTAHAWTRPVSTPFTSSSKAIRKPAPSG